MSASDKRKSKRRRSSVSFDDHHLKQGTQIIADFLEQYRVMLTRDSVIHLLDHKCECGKAHDDIFVSACHRYCERNNDEVIAEPRKMIFFGRRDITLFATLRDLSSCELQTSLGRTADNASSDSDSSNQNIPRPQEQERVYIPSFEERNLIEIFSQESRKSFDNKLTLLCRKRVRNLPLVWMRADDMEVGHPGDVTFAALLGALTVKLIAEWQVTQLEVSTRFTEWHGEVIEHKHKMYRKDDFAELLFMSRGRERRALFCGISNKCDHRLLYHIYGGDRNTRETNLYCLRKSLQEHGNWLPFETGTLVYTTAAEYWYDRTDERQESLDRISKIVNRNAT